MCINKFEITFSNFNKKKIKITDFTYILSPILLNKKYSVIMKYEIKYKIIINIKFIIILMIFVYFLIIKKSLIFFVFMATIIAYNTL